MKNVLHLLIAGVLLTHVGSAQEIEPIYANSVTGDATYCGQNSGCNGTCEFNWAPYYEKASRLVDLPVGTDFKTVRTNEPAYVAPFADLPATARDIWYVRKDSLPNESAVLYRCFSGAVNDYRDSSSTSEGAPAYNCLVNGQPAVQGNPWNDNAKANRTPVGYSTSGLQPLRRYLKTGGTDYKTWNSSTPVGYQLNTTFNGSRSGYERFGNLLRKTDVIGVNGSGGAGYGTYFLDNGAWKVDFNSVWGDSVGRITQIATGKQIVSEPIGDMVGSVVRFSHGDPDCRVPNPTMSGGAICVAPQYSLSSHWAGSPVITTVRTGTDPAAPQSFTSVVRPLDFCHNGVDGTPGQKPRWPLTTDSDPLIWNGFIERTDTLTCKLGAVARKDVLRTVSRYQLAGNHTGGTTSGFVINTHWLKITDLVTTGAGLTNDQNERSLKVYCKDLETGIVRQILAAPNGGTLVSLNQEDQDSSCGSTNPNDPNAPRHRHAVIAAKNDGTFAYAVARLNVPPGASTNVTMRCASSCTVASSGTLIIQSNTTSLQMSKTQWSAAQESFLVVNNKGVIMDNAVNRLNELNNEALTGGVNCLN